MNIKILVSCCSDAGLLRRIDEAVNELGITAKVEIVKDLRKIMAYGVMSPPGIVINEKVKSFGRIPGKDEIRKYIQDEMNA
jgi:hypothetical protein